MDSFLSIIIICVISSISSSTSIQLFSEEGIIHRLGEGFYHIKSDIPREYFINFKARQSMGVNVLGGIYYIYIRTDQITLPCSLARAGNNIHLFINVTVMQELMSKARIHDIPTTPHQVETRDLMMACQNSHSWGHT